MKTSLLLLFTFLYVENASALFGKGSLVCVTKKCKKARAKAADTYNKTGNCDGLDGKDKSKCEKYKKKDDRKMGKLSEEAKKIVLEGGNCDGLKGKDKRTCKRAARQKARIISRASATEGGDCAGKSGKELRQCQRTIKRDEKGKRGAFGFIGGKKANKQSQENWAGFNECKAALDELKASNGISETDYNAILEEAETARLSKSKIIGKSKALKVGAVAAAGVGAAAIGGGAALFSGSKKKLAAIPACNQTAIEIAKANATPKNVAPVDSQVAQIKPRSINYANDGKVAKGSTYVLTSTGVCKKLKANEPWHMSAHYNNVIECKKAAFKARSIGSVEESDDE